MKRESSAKIFNSALRECKETATYKCFSTLHVEDDPNEFRESFGQLAFINDELLSPRESITYIPKEDTQVLLLPLAGALNYHKDIHTEELVQSEQIKVLGMKKGQSYTFNNPFEKEWINYLHIGFKLPASHWEHSSTVQNIEFKQMNTLVSFGLHSYTEDQPSGYIGIYQGRCEGNYTLKKTGAGIFVYVIKGAFEVQGRLLEHRDGLSLWNTNEIEFEALSNDAIILLLETKLK